MIVQSIKVEMSIYTFHRQFCHWRSDAEIMQVRNDFYLKWVEQQNQAAVFIVPILASLYLISAHPKHYLFQSRNESKRWDNFKKLYATTLAWKWWEFSVVITNERVDLNY